MKKFSNGDASTGARGAFMIFMALYRFPEIRERAIRIAENYDWTNIDLDLFPDEIPDTIREFEKYIIDAVGSKAIQEWTQSLPEAERAKLLIEARRG